MDGTDRELGWEDVGTTSGVGISGQMGSSPDASGGGSAIAGDGSDFGQGLPVDAMTGAMVSHFANEFTRGSLSFWPQLMRSTRRYFNVTHGYVLRKVVWQILPVPPPKKKDGELTSEKDWTARVVDGLEVNIEEPDLYIPTMGFVTFVLLCGLIRGLQEQFQPEVLSATMTFSIVVLVLEVLVVKVVLSLAGAVNAPIVDIGALLAYKYFYLSVQIIIGLCLGFGQKPQGVMYRVFAGGLMMSCGVALWQSLRRLTRMHPTQIMQGQECMNDLHKHVLKCLPLLQVAVCYLLMPTWPKRTAFAAVADVAQVAHAAKAVAATVATTALPTVLAGNTSVAAVAAAAAAVTGSPS